MPTIVRIANPSYEIKAKKDGELLSTIEALYVLFDINEIMRWSEWVPPKEKIWWKLTYVGSYGHQNGNSGPIFQAHIETNAVGFSASSLDKYMDSLRIWEKKLGFSVSFPKTMLGESTFSDKLAYPGKKTKGARYESPGTTVNLDLWVEAPFIQ